MSRKALVVIDIQEDAGNACLLCGQGLWGQNIKLVSKRRNAVWRRGKGSTGTI